ncbi:hypothetical protein KQI42_15945 [Tissierella sp. MSJ-40]|uniref:Uncharacterized protein n=1 Tax=Tissierella simiarum TaxID=2841534 RepID=A0ABS6EBG5_9FIRM|nr:hypothetical protein [Tissierella simiarum]MBU5439508.1 hypothetical protein [Tissierella simiarum]
MNRQLSVELQPNIVYVYGKVNGKEVPWKLSAPRIWSAVVDKTPDGIYKLEITAYNAAGTQTHYELTTYASPGWTDPKTDWTYKDYYNFWDLNRVENNVIYISELLTLFDEKVDIETYIERSIDTIEFAESLNRIEKNIDILATRYKPSGWQESKLDWQYDDSFSYEDANRLERNLELLYKHYRGNLDSYKYCGMINVGEEAI